MRPLAVATCDLDRALVLGAIPYQGPFAFGHEGVAEVVEVGDGVESVEPGDAGQRPVPDLLRRVRPLPPRAQTGNCESVPRMSMYGLPLGPDYGGFLSDAVRVPYADAMLVPVPDGVDAGGGRQPFGQHPRRLAHRRPAARGASPARRC